MGRIFSRSPSLPVPPPRSDSLAGHAHRVSLNSVILAFGIALGGLVAGSEREAQAHLAIWPLRIVAASNDHGAANAQIQASVRTIRGFLGRHGVDTTGLTLQDFAVTDAPANIYGEDRGGPRSVITQTLMVRSTAPQVADGAGSALGGIRQAIRAASRFCRASRRWASAKRVSGTRPSAWSRRSSTCSRSHISQSIGR